MQDAAARARLLTVLKSLRKTVSAVKPEAFPHGLDFAESDAARGQGTQGAVAARKAIDAVRDVLRPLLFGPNPAVADFSELHPLRQFINEVTGNLSGLPAPPVVLGQLDQWVQNLDTKPANVKTGKQADMAVFNQTDNILFLNGMPLALSRGEKDVLAQLVLKKTAHLADLTPFHDRPDRVLKSLRNKHPKLKTFIRLPGGPGKGGYSTTIEPT